MTDAEKVLLPVLEGTIEDWIRFRKEAWQVNKSHWAFWCGVIATWNLLQNRKPNPIPRPTPPPPQPDITIIKKG